MSSPLSEAEATTWMVILLVVFFLAAGCAVPLTMWELKRRNVTLSSDDTADFWYTARNSQNCLFIALSVCATSAGAWLILRQLSWVGGRSLDIVSQSSWHHSPSLFSGRSSVRCSRTVPTSQIGWGIASVKDLSHPFSRLIIACFRVRDPINISNK